jgi:hypothetical protein
MRAHIFYEHPDCGASNFDMSRVRVCVDRKVHLTLETSGYDQSGDEENSRDNVFHGDLEPCDGSCLPTLDLPAQAEDLVRKFLASDGKERGEYRLTTPRYPNWVREEEDESNEA